ncbi:PilW family protein [Roseateles sp.]|uniref:PilW family protein n=1 Tax=Roseateles sp. TaxID=1971397 RepID=UPI0025F4CE92|nr:PilW family protein [Roseateles sp.]MBV8034329.1 PilW family protein [Roseateles sp.]
MTRPSPATCRGFSLIELMVTVAIGLVLTLTISMMVARQESVRRGVTSSNDLTSNTAYAAYMLDRQLRSAGAGFSQATAENYGCVLNASLNNGQLLPSTTAFPPPFATVPQTYVLAPLIVYAGLGANGSDVIAMATGNSGLSESGLPVSPKSTAAGQLKLSNTLGIRGGDLVLLAQQGVGCMLQQVSNGFAGGAAQVLTFGGAYAADTINGKSLLGFSNGNAFVSVLGNVTGNLPRFMLFGLDGNGTLRSYDLLKLSSSNAEALVDGVVDMRVLYGVDTVRAGLGQVTAWIAPTTAGYTAAELTAGTAVAQTNLQSVLAVRVGLILRSDLVDKSDVTPATLQMFSDLGAGVTYTYTVPTGTTNQRYRVVEFTVPLRNVRYSR